MNNEDIRIHTNITLMNPNKKIIYKDLSYKIVGILFKVYTKLGGRYQEKYYQRAIEEELKKEKIRYKKEIYVDLLYNEKKIGKYVLDFLINNKVVLEIKTVSKLKPEDFRQVLGYLKSKKLELGILANFRGKKVVFKRILNPELKPV